MFHGLQVEICFPIKKILVTQDLQSTMPNFRSLLFLNGVIKHLKREEVRESAEGSCYNEAYKIIANSLPL